MSEPHQRDLPAIISDVRRRWRLKLALRGATSTLALGVLLLVAAAIGVQYGRYNPALIVGLRIALLVAVAANVVVFVVRPLRRRVSDEQVALYLEEHEPGLGTTIVSAVDAARHDAAHTDYRSPALVSRLIESAIKACLTTDAPTQVEQRRLERYAMAATAVLVLGFALFGAGPAMLRNALSALLVSRDVQAAVPYRVLVTPGSATVPKGADQAITAMLQGFDADEARLLVRRDPAQLFESMPLASSGTRAFEGLLFNVSAPLEYQVETDGAKSPVFTLTVVDLPYVQQLNLEYYFPAYTGREPQLVENGGDIAVLAGTKVRAKITATMKVPGGRIRLNDSDVVELQRAADGTLSGIFMASNDGFYRVELDAPTGERIAASPHYSIDVLVDEAPRVSFVKPGRDTTASPIEEVFVEAIASDDYGVKNLELVYSVNGGAEKTLRLFQGSKRMPEVTAGHTFYLEEMEVKSGDGVSYYARAADALGGRDRVTVSDLYFVRVRPFKKDFRAAQSMAGGGGSGMGDGDVTALSEQQRQVISATFNVQRDRRSVTADKLKQNSILVGLSQSRLREQVEGLVARLTSRFISPDPTFKKITNLLPKAVAEMKVAEEQLHTVSPAEALPAEHRALGFLQQAEEEYETQISISRGGGGGGQQSSVASELAEMFETDLDKLANQYETADRSQQLSGDQQLDELLEKLKALARRQEQEAEKQRRRALGAATSGSGASQRGLAEQVEETARRLEKLSREQQRQDLAESAQRLRDAADAMRKAAASNGRGEQSQARAETQAKAALARLKETEQRLRGMQTARAQRDIEDARRQADEIARRQQAIADGVSALDAKAGEVRRQQFGRLNERKAELETELGDLERALDRASGEASRDEKEAGRRMAEAAGAIRDNRLRDKVRYSRQILGRASRETMDAVERNIAEGIDELMKKLDQAAAAVGKSDDRQDSGDDAVRRAQRLARGLESLELRTGERLEQGRSGQPQGKPGKQGQQGQAVQPDQSSGGQGQSDQAGQRRLDPEDIRQFRGESRQWMDEAQQLRGRVLAEGIDPGDLDDILKQLRQLDDDRVYKDASELQRLQSLVTEGLKRLEYTLRRQTETQDKEVVLSAADEVPDAFRPLVEQYYRSLSKNAAPPTGR
jgi:hypothetical protein